MPAVAALYHYPIKSCRGSALTEASIDVFGIAGDRRLLIIDDAGRFITQRETPVLAQISPRLGSFDITLSAPEQLNCTVSTNTTTAPVREVTIWRDRARAHDLGDEAASWLSRVVGKPARLVAIGPDFSRPVHASAASANDQTAFSDGHPLLVVSEASLEELNQRLDFPVPMNRFRPNIVIRETAPSEEDTWKRIKIGSVVLRASGPCARCVVTTTDQDTLRRGKEPLRTLATYRRAADGGILFGQNYIHETKSGHIKTGMPVEILG